MGCLAVNGAGEGASIGYENGFGLPSTAEMLSDSFI
jgi:hypothetical protein